MENLSTSAGPEQHAIAHTLMAHSSSAILALPSGGCARHVTSRNVELRDQDLHAPTFRVDLQDPHQIRLFETGAMTLRIDHHVHPGYTLVLYGKLTCTDKSNALRSYSMAATSIRLLADDGQEWQL